MARAGGPLAGLDHHQPRYGSGSVSTDPVSTHHRERAGNWNGNWKRRLEMGVGGKRREIGYSKLSLLGEMGGPDTVRVVRFRAVTTVHHVLN